MKCIQVGCNKHYHRECAKNNHHFKISTRLGQDGTVISILEAFCKSHQEEQKHNPAKTRTQRQSQATYRPNEEIKQR